MSLLFLRSRCLARSSTFNNGNSYRSSICRRGLNSEAASSKESIVSSESVIPDAPPPHSEAEPVQVSRRKSWSFLKFGLLASLIGATGSAGYATYAYSVDDMEKKAKAFRASAHYTPAEDASEFEKYRGLIYSSLRTASAKTIESYVDFRKFLEEKIHDFTEPTSEKLLPDLIPAEQHVYTLVLDLNETLVYSDWKRERGWRTFKRPGVDDFLKQLGQYYEIVVYSDELSPYVDAICERLDPEHYIRYRLSRGATKYQNGKHYRDLSKLNRDPEKIIYVGTNAFEESLQPENSIPIKPYKVDPEQNDTALVDLIPFLLFIVQNRPPDIRATLASYPRKDIAQEFVERSKEHKRRTQEQKPHSFFWRR